MSLTDLLHLMAPAAPLALLDMLSCAALGAVFAAFGMEATAISRRNAFLDKLALQLANMALTLLLLCVAASGAAAALFASKIPGLSGWALRADSPAVALGASLGFTLFSVAVYRSSWRNLRQGKGAHLYIGIMAVLGAAASTYTAMVCARDFTARFLLDAPVELSAARLWIPGSDSALWALVLGGFGLALCYAGVAGCAWLVLRRKRDDFGRDYYNFALPRTAKLALLPVPVAAAGATWAAFLLPSRMGEAVLTQPLAGFVAAGAALLLCVAACAVSLAVSKLPLRLKGLTMVSMVLLWGAHSIFAVLALVLTPLL